ncbi:MAG: hypothetical protein DWI27_03630 [Planctomycetota bacterium]|nr:MAG: hypothetical protein DWI27_03630 [Planctomycetota bacterium]
MQTPHIDQLAREGRRFTSGYCSASTCTPPRTTSTCRGCRTNAFRDPPVWARAENSHFAAGLKPLSILPKTMVTWSSGPAFSTLDLQLGQQKPTSASPIEICVPGLTGPPLNGHPFCTSWPVLTICWWAFAVNFADSPSNAATHFSQQK